MTLHNGSKIPKKSCFFKETNKPEIINQPVPEPHSDNYLKQTIVSSVFGTDIYIMKGDFESCGPQLIPGHEATDYTRWSILATLQYNINKIT